MKKGVELSTFSNPEFKRGRSTIAELFWLCLSALFVQSWVPGSWHRVAILRLFGAKIGRNVLIKPRVQIKFPWRLYIGDHAWIGENVWIDNLAQVTIGSNCVLSQGAYLCTGSHDWASPSFGLITREITLEDSAWIGAKACISPGITIRNGAVLTMSSIATSDLSPWKIYQGNPAQPIRDRKISTA